MTAISAATTVIFTSAYRQLSAVEKQFVDGYVRRLEQESDREQQSLLLVMRRPTQMDEAGYLQRPMVTAAIAERVAEISAANELSADRIIREWIAIAFSNHMDFMTVGYDGKPEYDLTKCTPEQMASVKKVQYERSALGAEKLVVETHDKLRALEVLSKYVGLVEPDNPHWRARNATPVLDASTSTADAADAYAALLGSD